MRTKSVFALRIVSAILFITCTLSFTQSECNAQWKISYINLTGRSSDHGGVISFKDGLLWAGKTDIWMSADSGTTWARRSIGRFDVAQIYDIVFFDKNTGLVTYYSNSGSKTCITHDQGQSWTLINSTVVCHSVMFWDTPSKISLITGFPGTIYNSNDGGASWSQYSISQWMMHGKNLGGGRGYLFCNAYMYTTTNQGASWIQQSNKAQSDSWTFDVDHCDDKRIYLVNEASYSGDGDDQANMYLSTDAGDSWTATYTGGKYDLTGALAVSDNAVYCQRMNNGILRSTDRGNSWSSIGGPHGNPDSRMIAAINDNIILAIDSNGSIWKTINSGGDSVVASKFSSLVFKDGSLFDQTNLTCDPFATATLHFGRVGCTPPTITNVEIGGPDASNYSAGVVQVGDSIVVTYFPKTKGTSHGLLILTLSDGTIDTLLLNGINNRQPFTFSVGSQKLFVGDTLTTCDAPLSRSLVINTTGCAPRIVRQQIIGPFSSDYSISTLFPNPLGPNDFAIITFKPNGGGMRNAIFELALEDGTIIMIPLEGVCKLVPFTYAISSNTFLQYDTLRVCANAEETSFKIFVSGCPVPKVIAQQILGAAAGDYWISHQANDSIANVDSVRIGFKPQGSGLRFATFSLQFANGQRIIIQLEGYGIAPHPLTMLSADQATDTLGGSVSVPITINGLDHIEDVELALHYDAGLNYHGSFAPNGVILDIPGEQISGRSRLYIPGTFPGAIAGYARFDVFKDSLKESKVTFDSLTIRSAVSPCQYALPGFLDVKVTPPLGCGILTLSRFLQRGEIPKFVLRPNPTSGELRLLSSRSVGLTSVEIYNSLGIKVFESTNDIKTDSDIRIQSESFPSGMYSVSIRGTSFRTRISFLKVQ